MDTGTLVMILIVALVVVVLLFAVVKLVTR